MQRNDRDRSDWIENDEGLWNWYRQWRRTNSGGKRAFLKLFRAEVDTVIDNVLSGNRPAHYLVYGG